MTSDEQLFELLMDKIQEYFNVQEELQVLFKCGHMRLLEARYSLSHTKSTLIQFPTRTIASLGIKVTHGKYLVDDMFNGSKLKGETCLSEDEIPAKAFPEDDLLTILAAKYDSNFTKNEPTRDNSRDVGAKEASLIFKAINPATMQNIKHDFLNVFQCIVQLANIRSDLHALIDSKQGNEIGQR